MCLEMLTDPTVTTLPCRHRLHGKCLWGILTSTSLGAVSMMRCPLCRQSMDRYDLAALQYPVSPSELARVSRGCGAWRSLLGGSLGVPSARVAASIQRCASLTARDGFVYNACVLALERMLHHKAGFARSLFAQLAAPLPTTADRCAFIDSSLACHVEVLIRTANHHTGAAAAPTTFQEAVADFPIP